MKELRVSDDAKAEVSIHETRDAIFACAIATRSMLFQREGRGVGVKIVLIKGQLSPWCAIDSPKK